MSVAPRRSRIALLIDRFDPARGGAERALDLLARALAARGHEVLAVAEQHAPAEHLTPIRIRARALTRVGRERALAAGLLEAAERAGADATVGVRHLERVDLYWPHGGAHAGALAARDASRARAPRGPSRRQRLFLDFERRLVEGGQARAIACVSALAARELARAYPAARAPLFVHENGVDLARFHPDLRFHRGPAVRARLGVAGDRVLVVCAARDPLQKGLPLVFDALAALPALPWVLWIAGPRDARAWAARAARRGIPRERLRIDADARPEDLWSAADLAVQPTWRDPCSLATLEALASGVPVVTTDANGAADAISSPAAGEVLACGDARALREALGRWIDRAASKRVEREAVRRGVLARGEEAWLVGLCERIEALARR